MTIQEYVYRVNQKYKTGILTEDGYRKDLKILLETIAPDVLITYELTRIACGAPDYIVTNKNIPIAYVEAKDIGKPLESHEYKEQLDRYKRSLSNLIITDHLEFHLYRDGEFLSSVSIGELRNGQIISKPETHETFKDLIRDFCKYTGVTISSALKLSKMMAGKARLLAHAIENALIQDEQESNNQDSATTNSLKESLAASRHVLIGDVSPKDFADIIARTASYGLFAARLYGSAMADFSRQMVPELIPESNPILRQLFQYLAGDDLDVRIKWIIDAFADIFRTTDSATLLEDLRKTTQQDYPVIHFHENFLAEYDPTLHSKQGESYATEPIVRFITQAVDDCISS
jgi:hypothetical protein